MRSFVLTAVASTLACAVLACRPAAPEREPILPKPVEACDRNLDEDGDGDVGCFDDDCAETAACDGDGDGYIAMERGGDDCDDGVPGVHPAAPDVCGDTVDADCSGADAVCGAPGRRGDSGGSGGFGDSGGSGA
jgi:hypothetical protein